MALLNQKEQLTFPTVLLGGRVFVQSKGGHKDNEDDFKGRHVV